MRASTSRISSLWTAWSAASESSNNVVSRVQQTRAVNSAQRIYNSAHRPTRNSHTRLLPNRTSRSRSFHTSTALSSSSSSSTPQLLYRIAVSSTGKGRPFNPTKNYYAFDPATSPNVGVENGADRSSKRRSRPDSGQDAFFASTVGEGSAGGVAFGVADGVGGWTDSGVDPADFSHGLCGYMAKMAGAWEVEKGRLGAKEMLQVGYDTLCKDKSVKAGGSTACVGIATADGRVETANLGDSGFLLLRSAAVAHQSKPQTHAFNTPYQLSRIPDSILAQASIFGGLHYQDLPHDADTTNLELRHGDILLLATDGVWDNLTPSEILTIVTRQMLDYNVWRDNDGVGIKISDDLEPLTKSIETHVPAGEGKGPQTLQSLLAMAVAFEAKKASHNQRREGPFAREVRRYYPNERWRGGKVDDIAVLVLVAVEEGKAGAGPRESKL